jgi:hypothetical protein
MKFGKIADGYLQPNNVRTNVTLRHFRVTIAATEKAIRMTYSECVFMALGFQHLMSMGHIFICGLSGCTIYFLYYLINNTILETKLLNIKCVSIFCKIFSESFLTPRRTEQDMIVNVY